MNEMTPLTSEELEALEHNWKHFGMLMDGGNIGRLLAEVRRCWQRIETLEKRSAAWKAAAKDYFMAHGLSEDRADYYDEEWRKAEKRIAELEETNHGDD